MIACYKLISSKLEMGMSVGDQKRKIRLAHTHTRTYIYTYIENNVN